VNIQEIIKSYEQALIAGKKSSHTIRGYMKDINKIVSAFSIVESSDIIPLSEVLPRSL